jgi:YYY domain-containing protein
MLGLLAWYVVLQAAALAVWPLVAAACAPLSDRGWTASKFAGILGVAWLAWLLCMLSPLPFTRAVLATLVLAVGVVSWIALRSRLELTAQLAWLRQSWRGLATWEAALLALFLGFALLRAHAPAAQGTEKPMDMAFLNGFVEAERLPTQDTWLSSFGVPYYYFGYFVFACLTKLSGVSGGVGYNLSAASVPALAGIGLAGLAWNLARSALLSRGWAVLAALLTALFAFGIGNLAAFFELLVARGLIGPDAGTALGIKNFGEGVVVGVWPPDGAWWFRASRIVPNTLPDGINEFPFFTTYLADLHPHFMALPFEALVLTCAAAHVLSRGATLRSPWTQGLAALSLGTLLIANTWDIAPFWLAYVGLAYATACCQSRRERLALVALAPLAGVVMVSPYFIGYRGPPLGLGVLAAADRTPLGSLLVLFGPQLVLLAVLGLLVRWRVADRRGWQIAAGGAVVGFALAILGEPTLGLLLVLVALLLPWPRVIETLTPAGSMALGSGWLASAMLLGVEVVYLDDVFHTRMNTVFKFDENAWVLIALATGVGVALALGAVAAPQVPDVEKQTDSRSAFRGVGRGRLGALAHRRWLGALVGGCAVAALALGLVYPVSAIATRLREQPPGGLTLDGSAFLSADEASAVAWLRAHNSSSRAVVAEAVAGEYSHGARMATYAGAASVLGWPGHELQWRGPVPELGQRQSAIDELYRAATPQQLRAVLDLYAIDYVVVGDLERQQYGAGVDAAIAQSLSLAYRSGQTAIYQARPGGRAGVGPGTQRVATTF